MTPARPVDPREPEEPEAPEAPEALEALADELRELLRPPSGIDPDVDARVLAAARTALAGQRPARSARLRLVAPLAAAAVAVVAFWIARDAGRERPVGDFDGDGRVDALDAYLLARAVDEPQAAGTDFDVDGDGRTDGSDVDRVLDLAVRLDR